jgi:hypothetical protein
VSQTGPSTAIGGGGNAHKPSSVAPDRPSAGEGSASEANQEAPHPKTGRAIGMCCDPDQAGPSHCYSDVAHSCAVNAQQCGPSAKPSSSARLPPPTVTQNRTGCADDHRARDNRPGVGGWPARDIVRARVELEVERYNSATEAEAPRLVALAARLPLSLSSTGSTGSAGSAASLTPEPRSRSHSKLCAAAALSSCSTASRSATSTKHSPSRRSVRRAFSSSFLWLEARVNGE